jgi:hypothetical protein
LGVANIVSSLETGGQASGEEKIRPFGFKYTLKRKQEDSENVENFATSLYPLSEHCGYNDIRDRIVVLIKDGNLSN